MKKQNIIFFYLFPFILISCQNEIDLTNKYYDKLEFYNLPIEVQSVFQNIISKRSWGDGTPDTLIDLTNENFKYKINTLNDGLGETLRRRGTFHQFISENQRYVLRANQGDPFVIFENKLYHPTSLNLEKEQYKSTKYYVYFLN